MPKIYLNCPVETFTARAKDDLAAELTALALEVEIYRILPLFAARYGFILMCIMAECLEGPK
ncbi:MAG: hypothetical protein WKF66_09915 [Pedobacter sp.]